jgi:hypothetical protein
LTDFYDTLGTPVAIGGNLNDAWTSGLDADTGYDNDTSCMQKAADLIIGPDGNLYCVYVPLVFDSGLDVWWADGPYVKFWDGSSWNAVGGALEASLVHRSFKGLGFNSGSIGDRFTPARCKLAYDGTNLFCCYSLGVNASSSDRPGHMFWDARAVVVQWWTGSAWTVIRQYDATTDNTLRTVDFSTLGQFSAEMGFAASEGVAYTFWGEQGKTNDGSSEAALVQGVGVDTGGSDTWQRTFFTQSGALVYDPPNFCHAWQDPGGLDVFVSAVIPGPGPIPPAGDGGNFLIFNATTDSDSSQDVISAIVPTAWAAVFDDTSIDALGEIVGIVGEFEGELLQAIQADGSAIVSLVGTQFETFGFPSGASVDNDNVWWVAPETEEILSEPNGWQLFQYSRFNCVGDYNGPSVDSPTYQPGSDLAVRYKGPALVQSGDNLYVAGRYANGAVFVHEVPINRGAGSCGDAITVTTGEGGGGCGQATLTGSFDPTSGGTFTYQFNWGPDDSYGNSTTPTTITVGSGTTDVEASISGLTIGDTYHFQLCVTDADDTTTCGGDASWTEDMCGPAMNFSFSV